MRQKVSERVKDRHLRSVCGSHGLKRLHHMRMRADDQPDAVVGKELRPAFLIRTRNIHALLAPVSKDDHKIRLLSGAPDLVRDRIAAGERIDHVFFCGAP